MKSLFFRQRQRAETHAALIVTLLSRECGALIRWRGKHGKDRRKASITTLLDDVGWIDIVSLRRGGEVGWLVGAVGGP
jgi:hypothetical protein